VTGAVRKTVHVAAASGSYDVYVGVGILDELGERLAALGRLGPVLVVSNQTVMALYHDAVRASLTRRGLAASFVEIPDGEQHKTMATLERILDAALERGADRSSVIVALGGGVVGDVAGFAAHTLLRGVRLYMVPTTLLAQVDSSVGGKTGVNRPHGKNLVGAFHQPIGVIADIDTLATLPDREYKAGLAEVVKYGVILDGELFALLEREIARIMARDRILLCDVIARCIAIKAGVVERDEREGGLRRILNFGHTVGHAIEKSTGYERFLHGEAVAMGMVSAGRLSEKLGACPDGLARRIAALLGALGLETEIPRDIDRRAIVDAVAFDKKAAGGEVTFVLAEEVGRCAQREIDRAVIATVL
jgi:3-dehydroquinate synthase